MGVLQRFERRLEGLVSGAFGRVFKAQVEPVEVAARLQRETDDRKTVVGEGRILVPNHFVVELGTTDYERLSPYAEPLGAELADMVSEHATENSYSFVGPVRVSLEHVEGLDTGRFLVRSGVAADSGGEQRSPVVPPPGHVRPPSDWGRPTDSAPAYDAPAVPPGPWLEVTGERGGSRVVPLRRPVTTIGRGPDCDVRLEDTGVSRRHAEVRLDGDGATVLDLGSTNGTLVNGERVGSQVLAEGDRLVVGSTAMLFRRGGQ